MTTSLRFSDDDVTISLSSDPLNYAEIFDKIVPLADSEALGYEMKIIQTLDFGRPLDDFFMVFNMFAILDCDENFLTRVYI